MFALHLDRRWFVFGSWRTMMSAATSLVRQPDRRAQIVVAPMSAEWLRQHEANSPKHAHSD
jgi:hypothetical protein